MKQFKIKKIIINLLAIILIAHILKHFSVLFEYYILHILDYLINNREQHSEIILVIIIFAFFLFFLLLFFLNNINP